MTSLSSTQSNLFIVQITMYNVFVRKFSKSSKVARPATVIPHFSNTRLLNRYIKQNVECLVALHPSSHISPITQNFTNSKRTRTSRSGKKPFFVSGSDTLDCGRGKSSGNVHLRIDTPHSSPRLLPC